LMISSLAVTTESQGIKQCSPPPSGSKHCFCLTTNRFYALFN